MCDTKGFRIGINEIKYGCVKKVFFFFGTPCIKDIQGQISYHLYMNMDWKHQDARLCWQNLSRTKSTTQALMLPTYSTNCFTSSLDANDSNSTTTTWTMWPKQLPHKQLTHQLTHDNDPPTVSILWTITDQGNFICASSEHWAST